MGRQQRMLSHRPGYSRFQDTAEGLWSRIILKAQDGNGRIRPGLDGFSHGLFSGLRTENVRSCSLGPVQRRERGFDFATSCSVRGSFHATGQLGMLLLR